MKKFISDIKIEATNLLQKSDEELELKIDQVKKRANSEGLDKVIIDWFALVQEISFRKIGLRHFETQLMAGFYLHKGQIVEMKTGEGKTLASTLPVSLNALSNKGVHVVTVNDYLAERDQKWMGKIYKGLGLSVGLVKSSSSLKEKRNSYSSNITYVTNSELVFDFLRDSSAYNLNELVQKPFNYCVIDEIDSILIDEARTPLILSTTKGEGNINKLYLAKAIANILQKDLHFQVDEKRKDINLTELGYKEAKEKLGKKTLYDPDDPWILELLNALKAKYIFKLNKDYIVLNNKILIVDEFTGRIMEDRRWSLGIHEAVEIKENVTLGGGTKTKSSITYQNFFTLYPKLAGMTGTGKTTEKEFQDIYNLEVVVLPTQKPMLRKDLSDLVYQTELSKWKAVLNQSKTCFEKGQPILIGTASVEKSEFLSELFTLSKIPHQVLNAKPENVTRESEIVAQAGEKYAVTIATNMAGRGTDIILGGNPIFKVKQLLSELLIEHKEIKEIEIESLVKDTYEEYKNLKSQLEIDVKNLPYSLETALPSLKNLYNVFYKNVYKEWEQENKTVKELSLIHI
jgi:preprotein translocase subunit SecA